jgi:hypothetical protein
VPTAGITTMKNHLVDGCIEGHCDCMFVVNTERWDYDRIAALIAPRPLCIANTDKDDIFPIDGVMEIYQRTRALYKKLGAEDKIGLQIAEGPHKDTQPLNTGEMHWFNRFLQGADSMATTDEPMVKRHKPSELRVFQALPQDETITTVDQWFGPGFTAPKIEPPAKEGGVNPWPAQRDRWMSVLKSDCFRAWPTRQKRQPRVVQDSSAEGVHLTQIELTSDGALKAPLWIFQREGLKSEELDLVVLNVLDDTGFAEFQATYAAGFPTVFAGTTGNAADWSEVKGMFAKSKWAMAYTTPRGAGLTSFAGETTHKRRQLLRRFNLVGETVESGQVWDIVQTAAALRETPGFAKVPLWLQAERAMAANCVYASLYVPEVKRLDLHAMPASHWQGPPYLNVLRHLDLPQAVAMAAERSTVTIYTADAKPWEYAVVMAKQQKWGEKRLQIRAPLEPVK